MLLSVCVFSQLFVYNLKNILDWIPGDFIVMGTSYKLMFTRCQYSFKI